MSQNRSNHNWTPAGTDRTINDTEITPSMQYIDDYADSKTNKQLESLLGLQ